MIQSVLDNTVKLSTRPAILFMTSVHQSLKVSALSASADRESEGGGGSFLKHGNIELNVL